MIIFLINLWSIQPDAECLFLLAIFTLLSASSVFRTFTITNNAMPLIMDSDQQSNIIFPGHDIALPMAVETVGYQGNPSRHLLIFF
jgi:hypothetical protein